MLRNNASGQDAVPPTNNIELLRKVWLDCRVRAPLLCKLALNTPGKPDLDEKPWTWMIKPWKDVLDELALPGRRHMLVWVLLVVLAACLAAVSFWPLDAATLELVGLVVAGALFLLICAVEARE